MFDINVLAKNIKEYRIKKGIKQYELAELLFVSPQSVSKWEQGLSVPTIENLCALSDIFCVSTDEILVDRMIHERLMVAVDGGGTKTEFVLFGESGKIRNRIVLEGCNPNICGVEKTCEVLKNGIDAMSFISRDISGIYCGIAGFLSGDNGKIINSFLKSAYTDVDIICNGDIFSIAASGTDEEKCIAVICGTGSNVCAINGNEIHRVGGWGYLFDGKGSGFDIGRDAITAALSENDGIGPETIITSLIEKKLGGSVWDNINRIYSDEKSFIASFSKEVFEAYKNGDTVAEEILKINMEYLCKKINFARETYDCGNTVIMSGGVIKNNDFLVNIIREKLNDGMKIQIPRHEPIYGACRICCKNICGITDGFEENFMMDYEKIQSEGDKNA